MRVSIESSEGLKRQVKIELPAEQVDQVVLDRLQQASKTISLKGFRKGKVPIKVVKRQYGKGIRAEVVGDLIKSSLDEAIKEQDLRPAGQPHIDDVRNEEGIPLEYRAVFDVYPEITLNSYDGFELQKPICDITESDVDKIIEKLREQRSTYDPVDRDAQEGDQVTIDYLGTKDGVEFPGGKAEDQKLVLGSATMIPGFESGLIGSASGAAVQLDLTFPDDYHSEELKGKSVVFDVQVKEVGVQKLPELDDEFFKHFGVESGELEKFRREVQLNMERELSAALTKKIKDSVMRELYRHNPIDVPNALVNMEIQQLKQQMLQQFGGGQEIDPSTLPDRLFEDKARYRAALGLLLTEVIQTEGISVDQEAVRKKIEHIGASYEDPQAVVDHYYSKPEMIKGVEMAVLEEIAVEKILEKSKVETKQETYEDAVKPDPEPDFGDDDGG